MIMAYTSDSHGQQGCPGTGQTTVKLPIGTPGYGCAGPHKQCSPAKRVGISGNMSGRVVVLGPTNGVPLALPAGPGIGGGTGKRRLSSASGGGASVASVRRKSNALMRLPDPVDVDLDADFFSSSQQIRRGDASTTGEGWQDARGTGDLGCRLIQQ